jgi:hypothetical protein
VAEEEEEEKEEEEEGRGGGGGGGGRWEDGEASGCRELRTLCLGYCRATVLLGCNTLLRSIAANENLTALDVR